MYNIGVIPMPADFKYREVFLKGRPQHDKYDDFSIRHPKMAAGKRAKIFAPFDALRGFNFAISRKEVIYEEKPELSREDTCELNRRLTILKNLTWNSHMAKINRVVITATYFVPCTDQNHEAFWDKGKIQTITGFCRNVDPDVTQTILINDLRIDFSNLIRLDGPDQLFRLSNEEWYLGG